MVAATKLTSPYPYFGGKSRIAPEVWRRLGNTPSYVEPFFGSGAVLLARPEAHMLEPRVETINDKDGMVSNFWRALQTAPDEVARWADWPANENDLHARHAWLVRQKFETDFIARLEGDPDYYDAKIAGWWVWGMACWIGRGFCSGKGPWHVVGGKLVKEGNAGKGVQRQLLHLGDAGTGVQRQLLHLGDAGTGVQRQLLHLGDAGAYGQGINSQRAGDIYAYFATLATRLQRVRVCSGDWTRVMGESVTTAHGLTAVFLDPPYTHDGRDTDLYNHDDPNIAADVRLWALEHGDNPLFRIAYCGYENGETWPDGWTIQRWKAGRGYRNSRANQEREYVAYSPHCLTVHRATQHKLFEVE